MTPEHSVDIARDAMLLAVEILGPLLLVVLGAGLLVGLLQAVTQVQDPTIGFVARLVAVVGSLLVLLPWMLDRLIVYSTELFERIPSLMSGA